MGINKETKICVSIAASPGNFGSQFHNLGYQLLGLNFVYLPLQVNEGQLKKALDALKTFNIVGCSVSMPHKIKSLAYLDELGSCAQKVGAVNTIKNDAGRLIGFNTDYTGARKAIEETGAIKNKEVTLIGAGGVAKAIAWAVTDLGGRLSVFNRTPDRLKKWPKDIPARIKRWDELKKAQGHLLINATCVGMNDNEATAVPPSIIKNFSIIQDVVLDPVNTLLIRRARALKKKIILGTDMCFTQAAAQFKIYTGVDAPLEKIKKLFNHTPLWRGGD